MLRHQSCRGYRFAKGVLQSCYTGGQQQVNLDRGRVSPSTEQSAQVVPPLSYENGIVQCFFQTDQVMMSPINVVISLGWSQQECFSIEGSPLDKTSITI